MRVAAPVLAALALAGCVNPYAGMSQPTVLPVPYYQPPAYEPPPVVFQPNPPPAPAYPEPLPKVPDEEPAPSAASAPDAATELPPAVPDATPPEQPPAETPAATAVQPTPAAPEKAADVPMMGFRPMRGQKSPGT